MLPSDGNPERASFLSPPAGLGSKKKRSLPDYPKSTWLDAIRSPEQGPSTLQAAVAQSFPDASPKKLERWIHRVAAETLIEPELLIFAAFLCGVQFRITHPEVRAVLGELWTWLTEHPRDMNPGLAELVIESIGPGLAQAIERRGWQRGEPEGHYIRKRGAPPKNRGAWITGIIVDDYLRQAGAKGKAAHLAADLVSVLLGRRVEVYEYYRFRKPIQQREVQNLAQEIAFEYEHWLLQDAVRARDFYSITKGAQAYVSWRLRHRPLIKVLRDFPGEQLVFVVLNRVPAVLWDPLWGAGLSAKMSAL